MRHAFLTFPAIFLLGFAIFCNTAGAAQRVPRTDGRNVRVSSVEPGSSFAIADFDGDHQPDWATVRGGTGSFSTSKYWIELRLSSVGSQFIPLLAPVGGLAIEARDVNGDHAVDLVLTLPLSKRPVAVFLNDGHGNFLQAEATAFPGISERSNNSVGTTSNWEAPAIGPVPQSWNSMSPEVNGIPYDPSLGNSTGSSSPGFALSPFLLSQVGRAPPAQALIL